MNNQSLNWDTVPLATNSAPSLSTSSSGNEKGAKGKNFDWDSVPVASTEMTPQQKINQAIYDNNPLTELGAGAITGISNMANTGINLADALLQKVGVSKSIPQIPVERINQLAGLPKENGFVENIGEYLPSMALGAPEAALLEGGAAKLGLNKLASLLGSMGAKEAAAGATYGLTTPAQGQSDTLKARSDNAAINAAIGAVAPTLLGLGGNAAKYALQAPFKSAQNLRKEIADRIMPSMLNETSAKLGNNYELIKKEANDWSQLDNLAKDADASLEKNRFEKIPTETKTIRDFMGMAHGTVTKRLPFTSSYQKALKDIKKYAIKEEGSGQLINEISRRIRKAPTNFTQAIEEKQRINQIPKNWNRLQRPDTRLAQRVAGKMGSALDNYVASKGDTPEANQFINAWQRQRDIYGKLQGFYKNPTPKGGFSNTQYNNLESGNYSEFVKKILGKKDTDNSYQLKELGRLVDNETFNHFANLSHLKQISDKLVTKKGKFANRLISALGFGAALHEAAGAPGSAIGLIAGYKVPALIKETIINNLAQKYAKLGETNKLLKLGAINGKLKKGIHSLSELSKSTPLVTSAIIPNQEEN